MIRAGQKACSNLRLQGRPLLSSSKNKWPAATGLALTSITRRGVTNTTVQTLVHRERPAVDAHFLRDCCRCPLCVDLSTQQKNFHVSELPHNLAASSSVSANGHLAVKWQNDIPAWSAQNHESHYSPRYLQQLLDTDSNSNSHLNSWKPSLWNRDSIASAKSEIWHEYDAFISTSAGLNRVVDNLLRYGISFIHGVPADESSVSTLAQRIGPLRNSFYGETWDVRSVAEAKNVAYTSQHLGFHQDLLYMAEVPGLQLLHVLQAGAAGGESLFADAAFAVNRLQQRPDWPEILRGLLVNVTYRYCNDGHWYQQRRPTLQRGGATGGGSSSSDMLLDPSRQLSFPADFDAINWSPPFQGPFSVSSEDLAAYAGAARELRNVLEDETSMLELRMEPGTCVIFNNRRIVHARRAFVPSSRGVRHLRGAYVDWDPLMSRWREARRSRGDITPGDEVRAV